MADRSRERGRTNVSGAEQFLKQMFGQVKVTFSINDASYLPLEDPTFVKELQSACHIRLTCVQGYDTSGQKQPAQYSFEGTLDEINNTRAFVDQWVSRSAGEEGQRDLEIPGNGPVPLEDLHDNGRADLDVNTEERSRRENDPRVKDGPPLLLETDRGEDRNAGLRNTADNKHRSRGNGESNRRSRHGPAVDYGSSGSRTDSQRDHTRDQQLPRSRHRQRQQQNESGLDIQNERQVLGNDGIDSHSGHTRDHEPSRPRQRVQDESGLDPHGRRQILENDLLNQNATRNSREGGQDSPGIPEQFLSSSAGGTSGNSKVPAKAPSDLNHQRRSLNDGDVQRYQDDEDSPKERSPNPEGGLSGHSRETGVPAKPPGDRDSYKRKGLNGEDHQRYGDDQVSSQERSQHPEEISAQSNDAYEDPVSSPEGAIGGRLQTPEPNGNINFVPVDHGVYAYMQKMFASQIKDVEKQFNVRITSEDMDVNESSMLKITPVGRASDETIRGANEAVVDLYSTVFSQLNHRVVELEGTSVRKETLKRAIGDVEKLYKEVMVKLSGNKVLIYGMKELDVKVAKAMVTNRLYDTARSSQSTTRNDEEDKSSDDHHEERPPHVGLEDRRPHQDSQAQGRQQDIDTNEMQEDANDADQSPRIPDEVTPRTDARASAPLKYRLRQDRLSFRTSEGLKVRVYQGDITKEKVGAIVNAANEGLIHAGGVARAIEKAAGPEMTAQCKRHITKHGMLYPSQVIYTGSGDLPSQYIMHAVGPRWDEYKNKDECFETLKTTFYKCLELADRKLQVAGICMPLISSGIFGMPIAPCIDALYEAIIQFSQSWQRDVNLLQEVNVVEIDDESVKSVQEHLIGKITGDGRQAVARHNNPEDVTMVTGDRRHQTGPPDETYQSRGRDTTGYNNVDDSTRMTSTGIPNRRNQQEKLIDDLFATNQSRFTHEGTQTSILSSNVKDLHRDGRITRTSHSEINRDDSNRFGMHKFSSLPNLGSKHDDYANDLPGHYKYRLESAEGSRTTQLSTHNNLEADREPSRTLLNHERLQINTGQRSYGRHSTSGHPPSYQNSVEDSPYLGAAGGVDNSNNESLIQTILKQHESGHQTPEQVEETQKLLDNLLGKDGQSSKSKSYRSSRRTQSLDRATRKSKGRDQDLGGYDLHSDSRVKRRDDDHDEYRKCTVCFSSKDLTSRKDCGHMLCRSCHKIGLYKGPCSLCKKSKSSRGADDQRGRSKKKKTPLTDSKALNPLHGHKDFHVAHGTPVTGPRRGPMIAKTSTSPSTSPELPGDPSSRLDPVGHAPERGTDYYTSHLSRDRTLPDSRKGNTRTEAWVTTSTLRSSSKSYDHANYTTDNVGARNVNDRPASPRQRRRQHERELAANLEGQHDGRTTRDKYESGGIGGGVTGGDGRGDASTTSPPPSSASCPICMDTMKSPKTLSECKHTFCAACIDTAMKVKALCPICGVVYGQLYGNQPAGTMTNYVEPTDLPGHERCGTIVISYRFPDGTQGEDHPNPGQPFRGTARMAYLPNNIEGQEVFRLLEKGFKARLLFTIGESATTGEQNTVIWNDIHHKTRRTGGAENHGYPDPSYLKRVKEELSLKGIK